MNRREFMNRLKALLSDMPERDRVEALEYYESYFNLMIKHDDVNFFDGEFPTLRFEKMTKEEFRETYGEERFNRITESEADGI